MKSKHYHSETIARMKKKHVHVTAEHAETKPNINLNRGEYEKSNLCNDDFKRFMQIDRQMFGLY